MNDQDELGRDPSDSSAAGADPQRPLGWAPAPPTFAPSGAGGYEPPPGGNYVDASGGAGKPGRGRGSGRWLAAGAAAVIVLGAVGLGGFELGSSHNQQTTLATQAVPSPASVSTSASAKLNVSKVVAEVDPGVVDINSSDAYTGASDAGTGMILTSSGEVLTNNHVIAGGTTITAQIDGTGPKYRAKVVGTDPSQDVALLQLQNVSGLHPLKMGNSATVTVGEPVVAIGNALALPGSPTVTEGIISALNRSITASDSGTGASEHLVGMFQTDAPLSPGNSGGPLVNSSGQVIAMNTAAATGSGGENASNIGFSIPINEALSIASQIQKGQASSKIIIGVPAFLGIEAENVSSSAGSGGFFGGYFGYTPPVSSGALVAAVIPNTPAASAGLVAGDVITSFGGQPVSSVASLTTAIDGYHPGQRVQVGWVTSSDTKESATVTLVNGPAA
jgi:S1-C subfamily serine protease